MNNNNCFFVLSGETMMVLSHTASDFISRLFYSLDVHFPTANKMMASINVSAEDVLDRNGSDVTLQLLNVAGRGLNWACQTTWTVDIIQKMNKQHDFTQGAMRVPSNDRKFYFKVLLKLRVLRCNNDWSILRFPSFNW